MLLILLHKTGAPFPLDVESADVDSPLKWQGRGQGKTEERMRVMCRRNRCVLQHLTNHLKDGIRAGLVLPQLQLQSLIGTLHKATSFFLFFLEAAIWHTLSL